MSRFHPSGLKYLLWSGLPQLEGLLVSADVSVNHLRHSLTHSLNSLSASLIFRSLTQKITYILLTDPCTHATEELNVWALRRWNKRFSAWFS